ncbi:MAG: alkaline phosphatase family protein [Flavobacteriia bacterium]|nr:alkaline phosphatase family protein [Flavobacteriia bacterium]
MRVKHFTILSILIAGVFLFSFKKTKQLKSTKNLLKTEYLVVFVMDGPRYTETFGDTSYQYIPNMGKKLKKEGVLYTEFFNNGVTHTNPGHTAITTGVYQKLKNNGTQLPKNPSFFQYYLKEKKADKNTCWIISSKGKLHVLANTKNSEWNNQYTPNKFCGPDGNDKDYVGDAYTNEKINEIYFKNHPKLCLINMLGVDVNGHEKNWEGYKRCLKEIDQYIYQFWQKIQQDPILKNKTALWITNDHGRHLDGHKDGFISHGDKCLGCRKISLLALGPDHSKGKIITKERELIDISKTISVLFQFSMPTSKGKFMEELFSTN